MKAAPWFKFFPSDWISGVAGLSAAERGVYVTLLAMIYDKSGPVPLDDARMARMCGLPVHGFRRALEALVSLGKITVEDGAIFNERAKSQLSEREIRIDSAHNAAVSSWEKRKQNQCEENGSAMRAQSGRNATCARVPEARIDINTEPSVLSPKPDKPVRTRNAYPEDFQGFWESYPTDANMSKAEASKAWARLSPGDRQKATNSLRAFRAYCTSNPEYRPVHACRYLSQGRFEGHAKVAERSATISVVVKRDSPQGNAWEAYSRATKGKGLPWVNGVWHLPSEWPPELRAAE